MKTDPARMSQAEQVEFLKKQLGYVTFSRPPKYWLKTGSRRLNYVLGSRALGIPYGKMLTLAGKPSSGKTLLALRLAAKAQADGAVIGWVDIENSFDNEWAGRQGLDCGEQVLDSQGHVIGYTNIALFQPEFGVFGKSGREKRKEVKDRQKARKAGKQFERKITLDERLQTAEELFTTVEKWLVLQRKLDPTARVYLAVDSTTALQPEEEIAGGYTDQNMRTKISLAPFLNLLTKRLVPIALHTNAFITLVSQLRTNPTAMFQNPDYVPGGNGVLFYPSAICWMRRRRNIVDEETGRVIGVESIIENKKNKMGGGSVEYGTCGMRAFFNSSDWKFVEVEELKK